MTIIKPSWYVWAEKEVGQREEPENRGPVIRRYIATGKCGHEGDPWCAIFVNAALEAQGLRGTRSPGSQSFRHSDDFVKLMGPALGAIVVFWRISPRSGLGHVGFYVDETPGYVNVLGGNESDAVRRELLAKHAGAFGLQGYWWPRSVPLPRVDVIHHGVGQQGAIGSGKVV